MRAIATVVTFPYCKKEMQLDEALTHQTGKDLQTQNWIKMNKKKHLCVGFVKILEVAPIIATKGL